MWLSLAVEDPSEDFVRLRDYVDSVNCSELASFAPASLRGGFSAAMVKECNERFKICRRQARKVYEILRLRAVPSGGKAEKAAFVEDVKTRLAKPFLVSSLTS